MLPNVHDKNITGDKCSNMKKGDFSEGNLSKMYSIGVFHSGTFAVYSSCDSHSMSDNKYYVINFSHAVCTHYASRKTTLWWVGMR